MFYSVASPDWTPGRPLAPTGALLFRSKAEALAFAPGGQGVAVAVRFDSSRSEIRPRRASSGSIAGWKAPAVENSLGGLTIFEAIPTDLVRPVFEVDAALPGDGEGLEASGRGFGGWDSLTMALLA